MHKTIIGAAAGLALLVGVSLSCGANATTVAGVGTTSSRDVSPIQAVACWCGVLGGSTAALRGGRSYGCSCSRASALRAPPVMPCLAHRTKLYCEANTCRWQKSSMTCI
jgi:hypothetical protein